VGRRWASACLAVPRLWLPFSLLSRRSPWTICTRQAGADPPLSPKASMDDHSFQKRKKIMDIIPSHFISRPFLILCSLFSNTVVSNLELSYIVTSRSPFVHRRPSDSFLIRSSSMNTPPKSHGSFPRRPHHLKGIIPHSFFFNQVNSFWSISVQKYSRTHPPIHTRYEKSTSLNPGFN
jgi:hypothetical protein